MGFGIKLEKKAWKQRYNRASLEAIRYFEKTLEFRNKRCITFKTAPYDTRLKSGKKQKWLHYVKR